MIDKILYGIGTFANGHWQWLGPALLIASGFGVLALIYYTFKEDVYLTERNEKGGHDGSE